MVYRLRGGYRISDKGGLLMNNKTSGGGGGGGVLSACVQKTRLLDKRGGCKPQPPPPPPPPVSTPEAGVWCIGWCMVYTCRYIGWYMGSRLVYGV